MHVARCYVKPKRGAEIRERSRLQLETGRGIRGDIHADSWSPRQVLLANEEVYREFDLPRNALRENLLVAGLDLSKLDSGQVLSIGKSVTLWLTFPCEVCFKLNRVRPGLAKVVAHQRGVLARVLTGGEILPGDQTVVKGTRLPALPPSISSRVFDTLMKVPFGRLITYVQLSRAVGVPIVYSRVFPRILKEAPFAVPVHRVVRSGGELIEKHVPDQLKILIEEGVELNALGAVPREYLWNEGPFCSVERGARSNWSFLRNSQTIDTQRR